MSCWPSGLGLASIFWECVSWYGSVSGTAALTPDPTRAAPESVVQTSHLRRACCDFIAPSEEKLDSRTGLDSGAFNQGAVNLQRIAQSSSRSDRASPGSYQSRSSP